MPQLTGGQAVVHSLRAEGIDTVFGIVGTHNVHLFDALYDARDIRLVTTRHEQGAAMMADGYARASGRVAAVFTVPGPGVTNALTGLGQAYSDSSPLLLVAAQIPTDRLERDTEDFHELRSSLTVAGAVSGWTGRATRVSDIPGAIRAALRAIRTRRPRPAYLEIPRDVLGATGSAEVLPPEEYSRPGASSDAIGRAAIILGEAERPIIYAGGGVISSNATIELLQVAWLIKAPIITSANGKGAVPDDHPLVLGDGWGRLDLLDDVVRQADAALVVGARFDVVSDARQGALFPQRLVHVDLDPGVIDRYRRPTVGIAGDAATVLDELLEALEWWGMRLHPWLDVAAVRAAKRRKLEELAGPVLAILDTVRASLERDAIVANDLNLVSYWAVPAFEVYEPRTWLHPNGFGTLGWALPAAIGAKIAQPARQVVALTGDGSFLYNSQELATAVAERLDLVVIVFNDNAFGALKVFQDRFLGGRRIGVELHNPDFARLAESYGARGVKLAGPDDLGPALRRALEAGGVTLIEVPLEVGRRGAVPPWMA